MSSSGRTKGPKRRSEPFMDAHAADRQPNKKPRFDTRNPSALAADELEEDTVLEADVIGVRGRQVRRNAVNIDGYDSDSENDNFDVRAATRARAGKAAARQEQRSRDGEEQDDMFADLAEEDSSGHGDGDDSDADAKSSDRRKKKAVRFLEEEEIEGQVKSSRSGGHVRANFRSDGKGKGKGPDNDGDGESSSDSEVDDAVRASNGDLDEELGAGAKKTHAPKLDAFNMRQEQEEGRFDEQGNYVRKAVDPDAKHDVWMEGISKKDMRAAKEAEDRREEDRRKRNLEDDSKSIADVLSTLIPLLDRGETILEALARLGKGRNKDKKAKWQTKQKNMKQQHHAANGDADATEADLAEVKRRQAVEAITAAADLLLTRGQAEVYDAERELLVRQYNREADAPWTDVRTRDETDRMWEYKWTDARDGDDTINGPFDTDTMRAWNDAGYFGDRVVFRQVGDSRETSWTRMLPV
ncbi:hypothetical protein DV736_g1034, partial [Chaetothyriales sp. CBS 134916]